MKYVGLKVVYAAITTFVTVSLNFLLFRAAPGDAVSAIGAIPISPAARISLRHQFRLDDSLWQQYIAYLNQLFRGNMGLSYATSRPVRQVVGEALMNTIPMVLLGTVIAIVIGTAIGTFSAGRRKSVLGSGSVGVSMLLSSFPAQWVGLMLILAFAGVLPTAGRVDQFATFTGVAHWVDVLRHMALPSTTIALVLVGQYVLIVRSAVLDTLADDYIVTAQAKGLSRSYILRRYALRNAALPISTMVTLSLGQVVAGSILVETVFSWPGIGRLVYDAVSNRDYPVLQGAFLVITVSVIAANLVADLAYRYLDPRVTV